MNPIKAVAGALMFAAAHLQAQSLAYNYSSTLTANESVAPITSGPGDFGNDFYVNSPISVNLLGLFASGGVNPFSGSQSADVSIFSISVSSTPGPEIIDTATLVTGATVTLNQSTGAIVPGTSTYAATITPVSLASGLYMVAVDNYGSAGFLPYYDNNQTPVNSASANTFGGYVSYNGYGSFENDDNVPLTASITDPDTLADFLYYSQGSYNAPRFADANFGIVAVPELGVSQIGVVGLVLVLFARIIRGKNQSKKA